MSESGQQDKDKALFANLVIMLSSSAMQYLGKIPNPVTQETEMDIDSAQVMLDMLTMLQTRTGATLTDDESRMLADVLTSLQMNVVETAREASDRIAL